MKMYKGVGISSIFLTSISVVGKWSDLLIGRLAHEEIASLRYPLDRRLGEAPESVWTLWKGKTLLAQPGIETPADQLVTIPTELTRFPVVLN
jgi:hypothetical protein